MRYQRAPSASSGCRSLAFVLFMLVFGVLRSNAGDILRDDFEDGILNTSIYQPTGGAIIEEIGGKLVVHVFATPFDGLRINIPEGLGNPKCLRMRQDVPNYQFPVGQAWRHTIEMQNASGVITGVQLTASRDFWNRCKYTMTRKVGGETQTQVAEVFAATKADNTKFECPGIKDVAFDWIPPADPNSPPRIRAEVTSKEAQAIIDKYKCRFEKDSDLDHGGTGENAFRITAWEVTAVENTGHN